MRPPLTTRRRVLRGAAGFTLALPLLPSLLPRAQASSLAPERRFVAICTNHGAVWSESMNPPAESLTETSFYAGHTIRRGDLVRTQDGSSASVSEIVRGPAASLTPELVAKMNVLRGLDIPFYIGHHRGGHLGNWAANDGNGFDGTMQLETPTIDQRLAWSNRFYADLSGTLERTLVIGQGISFAPAHPQDLSGPVQELPVEWSSLALFNRIFVQDGASVTSPRPPVVDRILENYRSLRQSDRRLSIDDRRRLDEHMQRIDELQRRLAVAVTCGDIPIPTEDAVDRWQIASFGVTPSLQAEFWQLFNDVIVAAFVCGTSRIAVMHPTDTFSEFLGDWHQDVAHLAHRPDGIAQATIARANQRMFEDVMLDLIRKLDVDEGDGTTILDQTLVQWTQESGPFTHESVDTVVVTAGSAGGALRTGQYIDYRNQGAGFEGEPFEDTPVRLAPGLLHAQYLATVLQAMGLRPSDYESTPGSGLPNLYVGGDRAGLYPEAVVGVRGEWLPWLRAA